MAAQPRAARRQRRVRSVIGAILRIGVIGVSASCTTADPGPTPVPSPPISTTTVFAVVRGNVVSGGKPLSLAELKIWGYKDVCRAPSTDSPLVVADLHGSYERVVEYLGSPGRACIVVRFYYATATGRDSLDLRDNFVDVKPNRNGAVPDTLIVNGSVP